jgi:hypothetical protein
MTAQEQITKYTVEKLARKLYRECLAWGKAWYSGMFLEIYYDAKEDRVFFSGGLFGNSWTNDPRKIGILRYKTPAQCKIFAEILLRDIIRERKAHLELSEVQEA